MRNRNGRVLRIQHVLLELVHDDRQGLNVGGKREHDVIRWHLQLRQRQELRITKKYPMLLSF